MYHSLNISVSRRRFIQVSFALIALASFSGCNIFNKAKEVGETMVSTVEKAAEQGVTGVIRDAANSTSREARNKVKNIIRRRVAISCDEVLDAVNGLKSALGPEATDEQLASMLEDFAKLLDEEEREKFNADLDQLLTMAEDC